MLLTISKNGQFSDKKILQISTKPQMYGMSNYNTYMYVPVVQDVVDINA